MPEEDGGGSVSDHGLLDLVLVAEEMGRLVSPGPLAPDQRGGRGPGPSWAPPSNGAAILPGLIDGTTVAAWCLGTDTAGFDPGAR